MPTRETVPLRMRDGSEWRFANGAWTDGEGGEVCVPEELVRCAGRGMEGMHYAFHRTLCCRDCVVRFEFQLTSHSGVGIVFRARDESHFYLLHFPNCGQQCRAQHFWAALSKMDGSGWHRIVKMELVRRVPSTLGMWLAAEVRLEGRRFSVRVGDYGTFEAEDETYPGPGHVGLFLASYAAPGARIRNVTVETATRTNPMWNEGVRQPTNWFHPAPAREDVWQSPAGLVRFPDGELLMSYSVRGEGGRPKWQDEGARAVHYFARSGDGGRTWSAGEPGIEGRLWLTPAGRLIRLLKDDAGWCFSESRDRGRSWSDQGPADLPTSLPHLRTLGFGTFLNLADGGMLLFGAGRHASSLDAHSIWTWSSWHCQAFACRSEDDGRTWSEPVNIDTPGFGEDGRPLDGNMDLTEQSPMQLSDGRVLVLLRPIYSPWMWEVWSDDAGRTWGPCVRGPFPGYATPNVVRTASGALLVAHRMPWLTVHCSLDDAHTWQGTTIDSGVWAMGAMCEVEPDLVLYVYMNTYESLMRGQYLRVTPSGLEPVRAMD